MKIVITPAKRMNQNIDYLEPESEPVFLKETAIILEHLKKLSIDEVKKLLKCSDKLAKAAYDNYQKMDLRKNTVPALLAYQGIQYDYLAAHILSDEDYLYTKEYLRILSGFYGVLNPFDGVIAYRLELNDKLSFNEYRNLYDFWGDKLYQELIKDDNAILDLGAKQYTKIIKKYLSGDIKYVKCYFMEKEGEIYREIGVYVKQARGEMVRFLINERVTDFEQVKCFKGLGYHYCQERSDINNYIFIRERKK